MKIMSGENLRPQRHGMASAYGESSMAARNGARWQNNLSIRAAARNARIIWHRSSENM